MPPSPLSYLWSDPRMIYSKAKANLIATFLQTATGKTFQISLYHSWLFRYHVLGKTYLPNPGFPPFYPSTIFAIMREVHENSPLNPVHMSVKQCYTYILERDVIERDIDDEGRRELIPCKVEERDPSAPWMESYRLKGVSPTTKSSSVTTTNMLQIVICFAEQEFVLSFVKHLRKKIYIY